MHKEWDLKYIFFLFLKRNLVYNEIFYQNTAKAVKIINRKWKKFKISIRYSKEDSMKKKVTLVRKLSCSEEAVNPSMAHFTK